MHLRSLIHLLEAVQALVHPGSITVLGSSSLLAFDAALGNPGEPLELSLDADLLLAPCTERMASILHEAVGEGSLFHKEFGVFADLLRPDIMETLPAGWKERTIPLPGFETARCLHITDLAMVKLALGRDKDMHLLRQLLSKKLLTLDALREHYTMLELDEHRLFQIGVGLRQLQTG